uniref:Uncharacterized protein n=1 Tax=Anguilla anguilla TaxID=7936 RepID=A0A0E9VA38_ANGAN
MHRAFYNKTRQLFLCYWLRLNVRQE